MNIEETLENLFFDIGCCQGDLCNFGEHKKEFIKELTTLIQQERERAVRGFIKKYEGWLEFIPSEYDRTSVSNSMAITAEQFLKESEGQDDNK